MTKRLVSLTAALGAAYTLVGCAADAAEPAMAAAEQAIVGGQNAAAGQFQGIVSLRDDQFGHICGGSLIAPSWVLTAGHCVDEGFRGRVDEVVAGSLDLAHGAGEHLRVLRAYRHPDYDEGVVFPENDVALLRLASEATSPLAKLASAHDMLWLWPGTRLEVAGWGLTDEDADALSETLKYTEVPLVAHHECKRVYGNFLPEQALCAGFTTGGHDACQGDSGGPLFAKLGGQSLQVGVVSAGIGCADNDWYGLYTGVAYFSDWIANTIAQGDRDAVEQSACLAQCEVEFACAAGDQRGQCLPALDRCLCGCAHDQSGLCSSQQADTPAADDPLGTAS